LPVVLWLHHSDLADLWFSDHLLPGQDPANVEYADEQMNLGFSTGAVKPKQPFLLERDVDTDDIFRQAQRGGRGGGKRRNRTRITRKTRIIQISTDIDAA